MGGRLQFVASHQGGGAVQQFQELGTGPTISPSVVVTTGSRFWTSWKRSKLIIFLLDLYFIFHCQRELGVYLQLSGSYAEIT